MENVLLPDEMRRSAIIIGPAEETFSYGGNAMTVSIPTAMTSGRFGLYQIVREPFAKGPKLHFHTLLDEVFIITEGILTVITDASESDAGPDTVIYIPSFAAHGYTNNTDKEVKLTMLFSPGKDREKFFRKLYEGLDTHPEDTEFFLNLYKEYDSYPLDQKDMVPMR